MENYINNIEELVGKSMEYFNSKYDMPKEGIFAGGALANYINYLVTGKKPIINDIDIFILSLDIFDEQKKYNTKNIYNDDYKPSITHHNDYTHVNFKLNDENSTYYTLSKTERIGDINYIYSLTNNTNKKINIIETFDINQTQIAFDLSTKQIYYTDNFVHFLNTQKLEIVYMQSPIHSILRALKKSEESQLSFDHNYYISLYKEMENFEFTTSVKTLFGSKYKELYDRYINHFIENGLSGIKISKQFYDEKNNVLYHVRNIDEHKYRILTLYKVFDSTKNTEAIKFNNFGIRTVQTKITLQMFYDMSVRYFGKNKRMWGLFKKFNSFFYKTNYVDLDINNDDDVLKMKKIYQYKNVLYPSLYDKTMSEQLHFISLYEMLDQKDKELINRHTPNISPIDIYDLDEKIFLLRLKNQK